MAVQFIPKDIVLAIHADLIHRYGGEPGIRDPGLLDSALAQPGMILGRRYVHSTLFDKAAAYGFHVCMNHPFIDGNKRSAFVLMDIFLQRNGWEIASTEEDAYQLMMILASGKLTKARLSSWLKAHSLKSRPR